MCTIQVGGRGRWKGQITCRSLASCFESEGAPSSIDMPSSRATATKGRTAGRARAAKSLARWLVERRLLALTLAMCALVPSISVQMSLLRWTVGRQIGGDTRPDTDARAGDARGGLVV